MRFTKVIGISLIGGILWMSCSTITCGSEVILDNEYEAWCNVNITFIKKEGYRVDWSTALDRIVFDMKQEDGYYDIYVMNPDGTDEQCLTDAQNLPLGHKGCATWHPSGDYIVFTCEKERYFGQRIPVLRRLLNHLATPGSGINCDLWMMNREGTQFWQLTDIPTKTRLFEREPYTGVLHPHFSRDGTKLLWSQRIGGGSDKWGEWTLNVAEFSLSKGTPSLHNVTTYQPGDGPCFYESHGFSPDGTAILFSGNLIKGQDVNHLDIYTYNLNTGETRRLTDAPDEWDEHAHFSPDGKRIVWMSSRGYGMNTERRWWDYLKTDYWIMTADGSQKTKISFYNEDCEEDTRVICSDCSWNPEGTKIATTLLITEGETSYGGIGILDIPFT
jgi:Tol biopolymer transport system component